MATQRRSLRVELLATLTIVIVMAVVSLSLFNEVLGTRRHTAAELERLDEHAKGISVIVTPMLSAGPSAARNPEVERLLRASVGNAGIVALEIHQIAPRPQVLVEVGLAPELPPPEPFGVGAPASRTSEGPGVLVVDRTLRTFGPGTGSDGLVLRLVSTPAPWTSAGDWQATLLLAGGVGAVLLLLGGILLEVQVLRPVREVRAGATRVALGNLDVTVPDEGPAELQTLAGAFNQMTSAMAQKLAQIEAQRAQLARAQQLAAVGRIAAGVAHEVGNPLAAILGYVELLLDTRSDPPLAPEQRIMLERTRTQIQRIQGIVGQLLAFSRPADRTTEPTDLAVAAKNLVALLRHDPRVAEVTLEVVSPPEPLFAPVDPGVLDQIVQNLVFNACRAAHARDPAHAAVTVFVLPNPDDEDCVALDVQDTGPGIADEVRNDLFEPFFTTARAGEGTGLGLAISRGLAESVGGTLTCLDGGARPPLRPGGPPGAVFRLSLPRVEQEVAQSAVDPNPATAGDVEPERA